MALLVLFVAPFGSQSEDDQDVYLRHTVVPDRYETLANLVGRARSLKANFRMRLSRRNGRKGLISWAGVKVGG